MKTLLYIVKKIILILTFVLGISAYVSAAEPFVSFDRNGDALCLTGKQGEIVYDKNDWKGVEIAVGNLKKDLEKVTGSSSYPIVVGTLGKSAPIDALAEKKLMQAAAKNVIHKNAASRKVSRMTLAYNKAKAE